MLLCGDVIDAGHEEEVVGVLDRGADALSAGEQALYRFSRDAEVGHPVPGEPLLPVAPLGQ